jgi:hypothetical protein
MPDFSASCWCELSRPGIRSRSTRNLRAPESKTNSDSDAIRYETYRLRTSALEAMFRVQLVTESRQHIFDFVEAARKHVDVA